MPLNLIGPHAFISLGQCPDTTGEQPLVLSRPGVDGVAIWKTGERGRRFELRSAVDAASMAMARNLFDAYKRSVGGDPVPLVWAGLMVPYLVVVLDVQPIRITANLLGVGGLSPPSYGWCECNWTLIPMGP